MKLVAVDLGGTHARFALAEVEPGGRPQMGEARKYKTADYPDLSAAWAAFAKDCGCDLPSAASIAIAGPVEGELIRFTNSSWTIRPKTIAADLGIDKVHLLNDFAAMAAAVSGLKDDELVYVGGPPGDLPDEGVTTIVGPGTGLGVAQLLRRDGKAFVLATEGGHLDFAPLDPVEEKLLTRLRERYRRVSTERIVSGPGLSNIYESLAASAGIAIVPVEDPVLWQAAIDGTNRLAASALDRFVMILGSVAGDLALAHGANAVVLTGGLSNRVIDRVAGPLFNERFRAKGRFEKRMGQFPIRLAVHPEPGLLGAATAFGNDLE
ncbi:glucokinase [Sphingomonas montanisoli]|uniref:Glucokinase n=1 Tax=Sphingomonas montanisoli TaxID=2606412 RepID=A0A5D9C839_9SPHN|nr:glucokinase [Sphingomonas montanisoli]TZG26171.1 glucokinase [Sphingomonas montanisoli]